MQLIDLDAAMRQGDNSALVEQIAKRLPVQAGGGIHTIERARQVLEAGAKRVIIGSALFSSEGTVNTEFAAELAESVGAERVVAGIDTKNGRIAVKGWKAQVELTPDDAIPQLEPYAAAFLYTHVDTRRNDAGISHRDRCATAQADADGSSSWPAAFAASRKWMRWMRWARTQWWAWRCIRKCWRCKKSRQQGSELARAMSQSLITEAREEQPQVLRLVPARRDSLRMTILFLIAQEDTPVFKLTLVLCFPGRPRGWFQCGWRAAGARSA